MPSGNAIYTYTGENDAEEVQGQIFLKDRPRHITDNGVISVLEGWNDFVKSGENFKRVMDGLHDAADMALAAHLEELGVTDDDIDAALENAPITKMDKAYKAAKPKGKAK